MNAAAQPRRLRPLPATTDETSTQGRAMLRELERALARSFQFTRRERLVVRQLLSGESVDHIARRLELRVTSVHKHMHRIFAKTRTEGRQRLLRLAFRLAAHRRIAGPQLAACPGF